ncbi:hypothetical protein C0J52_26427, partial [Blattella germanica]
MAYFIIVGMKYFTAPLPPPVQQAPIDPCVPSPCGPNSQCQNNRGSPSCSCLPTFIGMPPNCRPECTINSECPRNQACIREKCRDPCPGSCGVGAQCNVQNHIPVCTCLQGYTGDPFTNCRPIPPQEASFFADIQPVVNDPCNPSPCGPNAQCANGICSCLPEFQGDPYSACRPECVLSNECPRNRACIRNKCVDPCTGTCGQNAICTVQNHIPICSCPQGYTGNPFVSCRLLPPETPRNPCSPSPCGPNSQCREINGQAVCSCVPGFIGSPPACRPECVVSSECVPPASQERPTPCVPSPCGANAVCREQNGAGSCTCLPDYVGNPYEGCRPECILNSDCPSNRACIRNKCQDPCPGTCGQNADCQVVNHLPSCTCRPRFTGDPFRFCNNIPPEPVVADPGDPCNPSPCGPNSQCRNVNGQGVCSCLPNYIGSPPGCRPECVVSSECPQNRACVNQKCVDPCPGTCGLNTRCEVVNHSPICSCQPGFTGDPFTRCFPIPPPPREPIPPPTTNPCVPSPCGPNSQCRDIGGSPSCSCLPSYTGNPCPGTCGQNADCQVVNHLPSCTCRLGFTGDPFRFCNNIPPERKDQLLTPKTPGDPCNPSPCGPNSQCRNINGQGVCSCLPNYIGSPPGCRPECVVSTECPQNRACVNQKCIDPCPGTCGLNARCEVVNHSPICSCQAGFTGDPFTRCFPIPPPVVEERPTPCIPSPCGANAVCREQNGAGSCTCLPDYVGNPYEGCRPECVLNTDCPSNRACIRNKCQDPCPGTCGQNADCQVVNHLPSCTCRPGFTGDPFRFCNNIPPEPPKTPGDPCNPSPCGPNSQCRNVNGQGVCSCLPNYIGSPPGCRPECVVSSECPQNRACVNQKCTDPCPGTCGLNTRCEVVNHSPICSCQAGFTGDPFTRCFPIPPPVQPPLAIPTDPCVPSPCGPNSQCRNIGGAPSCSCLANYMGIPPNCRPECSINSECPSNRACIRERCQDPCPGSCGVGAQCSVINHTPVCTCPEGFTGDPFSNCVPRPPPPQPPPPSDPCNPSPCGSNAQCNNGICTCLPEYQGDPYAGCRPECVLSTDCPRNRACIRNKCTDPCPGTCGQGAICDVVNHIPICSCPQGMSGNPFVECRP